MNAQATETKTFNEVVYATDRTTFLSMKAQQKEIFSERRTHSLEQENTRLWNDWVSKKPVEVDQFIQHKCDMGHYHSITNPDYKDYKVIHDSWRALKPCITNGEIYTKSYARNFNIVYSMIRGRTYKQVESKVRENNKPDLYEIKRIIKAFNLDETFFFENGGLK